MSPVRPPRRRVVVTALLAAALVAGTAAVALDGQGNADDRGQQETAASSALRAAGERAGADESAARARGAAGGLQDPILDSDEPESLGTPVRIVIPAARVDASLQRLHRDGKGVLLPPRGWTEAGWFAGGVVPGAVGPAVIAGHLDDTVRAAVFSNLRVLRPGDRIRVVLSSKRTVSFVVTHARVVRKALFPTDEVYGPTPDAQLRLITCNQPFDPIEGHYTNNLVVFARKA